MIAPPIPPFSRLPCSSPARLGWMTPTRKKMILSLTAGTANEREATRSSEAVDPGTAFKLLLSCPSGLPQSRVYIDFKASYDRIPRPDANLEESINKMWNQRVQDNPSLYNGKKFRYGGHTQHYVNNLDGESSVCLHLGLTDYSSKPGWRRVVLGSCQPA